VIGSARIAAGGRATLASTQPIGHAHLWSNLRPLPLQRRDPAVRQRRGRREAYRLAVGIRSITVVDGHLELNYQPLNLRRLGLMEDDPTVGRALSDAQRARQMGWVALARRPPDPRPLPDGPVHARGWPTATGSSSGRRSRSTRSRVKRWRCRRCAGSVCRCFATRSRRMEIIRQNYNENKIPF